MIVDKGSQVYDDDLFPMFHFIAYNVYPHDINWPETVFCGDPYQLPPIIGSQRTGPYYYSKWFSFLELLAPEYAPVMSGCNNIAAVDLNLHYRMINVICHLSSVMTHCNVLTRTLRGSHTT